MLTVDFNYDEPCNILDEEFMRGALNIPESTELEEAHEHTGCSYAWGGNKIILSFGGEKPYSSVYDAEYQFDKLYQGKSEKPMVTIAEAPASTTVSSSEGTNPAAIVSDSSLADHKGTQNDDQPEHAGESAEAPALTKHAVNKGNYKAVTNVGDKAVWDASTGQMHVLYNNHIINVTVETKDKAEVRKEHAQNLAEVLMEKIADNEYVKRL